MTSLSSILLLSVFPKPPSMDPTNSVSFLLNAKYLLSKKTSEVTSDELNEFINVFHPFLKDQGFPVYDDKDLIGIFNPRDYRHTKIGKLTIIQMCTSAVSYWKRDLFLSEIDTTYEIVNEKNNCKIDEDTGGSGDKSSNENTNNTNNNNKKRKIPPPPPRKK